MTVTESNELAVNPRTELPVLNVAAYKFVTLDNLVEMRRKLKADATELGLRGTILLSSEGINLFLAGPPSCVRQFLDQLRSLPPFVDLHAKESFSEKVPFRRMLVRLKKEIIPCGDESVRPAQYTSARISPKELKQWFDEGRRFHLLDTRNKDEVDLGTFEGAQDLGLGHFRDFTAAIDELPESARKEPVVTFCTGGIRCEKAGPLLEQAGFKDVYQLDGGILKYFEEIGGDHYQGSCFVFDGRVALDPQLHPTGNLLCFACQAVLTADDVTSGKFMFGEYCPRCYEAPDIKDRRRLEERQAAIRRVAESQPGCVPYTNCREIHVPGKLAGRTMIDFLCQWQPAIAVHDWQGWLDAGQITTVDGESCQSDRVVREGEAFIHAVPNTVEPGINPEIELLYEDEGIVVVNKPAPLPCHPSGRFNKNSLLAILSTAYPKEKLRVAHRLDGQTTGVVVLCRKHRSARSVQKQFADRTVRKTYLARLEGHTQWDSIECSQDISGSAVGSAGRHALAATGGGKSALTKFKVLARFDDGTTLVRVEPVTGRTNQIRIHAQSLGHSIVGDPLYGPTGVARSTNGLATPALHQNQLMCLHAERLELDNPTTGERVTFRATSPAWAAAQHSDLEP